MYKVQATISVKLLLGNAKDSTEKTDCTGFVETIRCPSEMMKKQSRLQHNIFVDIAICSSKINQRLMVQVHLSQPQRNSLTEEYLFHRQEVKVQLFLPHPMRIQFNGRTYPLQGQYVSSILVIRSIRCISQIYISKLGIQYKYRGTHGNQRLGKSCKTSTIQWLCGGC